LGTAPTGPPHEADRPIVLSADAAGHRAVTANSLSDNLAVVDLRTEAVEWIDVLDRPIDALVDATGTTAVVAHAEEGLAIVDLASATVDAVLRMPAPIEMGISPDGRQAWILAVYPGIQKRLVFVALAGAASHELGSLEVGSGFGLQSSPKTRRLATTPSGRILFVDVYENELWIIDGYARAVEHVVGLPYEATDVTVSSGDYAYVEGQTELERFDLSGTPLSLGLVSMNKPELSRIDEAAGYLYVHTGGSAAPKLEVVDVAAMSVVKQLVLPAMATDGKWSQTDIPA
jgi:DNA-binding beta-propeller fold protein YncE